MFGTVSLRLTPLTKLTSELSCGTSFRGANESYGYRLQWHWIAVERISELHLFISQQKRYPLSPAPSLPSVVLDSHSIHLSIPLHLFFPGGRVITVSLAGLASDSLTYFGCHYITSLLIITHMFYVALDNLRQFYTFGIWYWINNPSYLVSII